MGRLHDNNIYKIKTKIDTNLSPFPFLLCMFRPFIGHHQASTKILIEVLELGRAVDQAVSRWLPTAAARVRIRVTCGVCGGQSGIGAGVLANKTL
jgi:hypothetical protein